ncbi:uncharacterized protein LOC113299002 [Papaver somniferum]|uniref:uncharacterized protein LOC113299002 n=1 Tax=Papaver somniferum TaxID=3469 RepID=UPI000E6FB2EB|nr:uncharacterized protein LOC113299002 [Papaver somniferum]
MTTYLGNLQFGVGISCGGEGIIHSANRLLEMKGHDNFMTMLLVDFSNAFNLVDRSTLIREGRHRCPSIASWIEFCYSSPARLYYNDVVLSSAQEVQQGDPLGPLLFALALHPIAENITTQCSLDLHAWYLDDGTIVGDTMEVSKALKIIQTNGPARGLHVNVTKTEVFWPSLDLRRDLEDVFPVNIGKSSRGVKLLGGPVSLDMQYCSEVVQGRVDKTLHLWEKVQKLYDPQSELLLLRSCSGVSKLYFTLQTTAPLDIQSSAIHYDSQLMLYLRQLVVGDSAGFGLLQRRLATLPIKDGGFGIYTLNDTCQYCFLASCAQNQHLQQSILKQSSVLDPSFRFKHALQSFTQVCGLSVSGFSINDAAPQYMKTLAVIYFGAVKERIPTNFSLTDRDLTLWHCNRTPHAMDFLKAIPIHGINQAIAPRQFR